MTTPSAGSARRTVSSSSADPRASALADAGRYTRSDHRTDDGAHPVPDPESRRRLIGAVAAGLLGLTAILAAAVLL